MEQKWNKKTALSDGASGPQSIEFPFTGSKDSRRPTGAAIDVRVSAASRSAYGDNLAYDQDPSVQQQPLLELLRQRDWQPHRVYSDPISGSKQRRPGSDELMADARRGKFEIVVVWRFDLFARSVKQLVLALEEFRSLGIDFVSHQEALDTGTPMGKAMFTIIAAMAELERSVIRQRVKAGLKHAHEHGTKSGRPVGRRRAVFDRARALKLRQVRWSWGQIARKLGTSLASVRRAYQSLRKSPQL